MVTRQTQRRFSVEAPSVTGKEHVGSYASSIADVLPTGTWRLALGGLTATDLYMSTPAETERSAIMDRVAERRFGVRIPIHVSSARYLGDIEDICLSLPTGAIANLTRAPSAPWEAGSRYLVRLEGFRSEDAAREQGRRLVQAFIWAALSLDFSVRAQAVEIFDRTILPGIQMHGFIDMGWPADISLTEIHSAFAALPELDPGLALSMEILAGARLESSDRAQFLSVVSSLEPLAAPRTLGAGVDTFISACMSGLAGAVGISQNVRLALKSRLGHLKKESIGQALRRLVEDALPLEPAAAAHVDAAYAIRSQIMHDGKPKDTTVNLVHETRSLYELIRRLHSKRLDLPIRAGGAV